MEFLETSIAGAYLIRRRRIEDCRGYFSRAWCAAEFAQQGVESSIVQMNMAVSHRTGTLRGLHYQRPPHEEAKIVWCTRGAIYDVIVDLRPESPTHGRWFGVKLTAGDDTMLYAPRGFAHGYQTLSDDAEMYYLTTAAYAPMSATGVRFDDPALDIDWPVPVSVISDADRAWPDFKR